MTVQTFYKIGSACFHWQHHSVWFSAVQTEPPVSESHQLQFRKDKQAPAWLDIRPFDGRDWCTVHQVAAAGPACNWAAWLGLIVLIHALLHRKRSVRTSC